MEKDLGVIIINDSLSSLVQIVEVINKSFRMLGYINRNVSYKKEVIAKLYCAYVRLPVEYCVLAWSLAYEKDCWLLERVIKKNNQTD